MFRPYQLVAMARAAARPRTRRRGSTSRRVACANHKSPRRPETSRAAATSLPHGARSGAWSATPAHAATGFLVRRCQQGRRTAHRPRARRAISYRRTPKCARRRRHGKLVRRAKRGVLLEVTRCWGRSHGTRAERATTAPRARTIPRSVSGVTCAARASPACLAHSADSRTTRFWAIGGTGSRPVVDRLPRACRGGQGARALSTRGAQRVQQFCG